MLLVKNIDNKIQLDTKFKILVDNYGLFGIIVGGICIIYNISPNLLTNIINEYGISLVISGLSIIFVIIIEGQVIWWLARELRRVQEARVQELEKLHIARVRDANEILNVVVKLSDRTNVVIDKFMTGRNIIEGNKRGITKSSS